MNCSHCGVELSERGSFCKACAGQVRCVSCRALLEPGAMACVECGKRVEAAESHTAEPHAGVSAALAPNRNSLTFHEDRNSRRFEASLTDGAMQGLGDVFGELFAQRGVGKASTVVRHFPRETATKELGLPQGVPAAETTNTAPAAPTAVAAVASDDQARVLKLFHLNGDKLELIDNRLKASKQADYVKRLTYIYLYAHECHGRGSIPAGDVRDVLRSAKVLDTSGNANRWLLRRVGIADDGDDRLKLTVVGREAAIAVLNEALNPTIADTWNPDQHVPKVRSAGSKKKTP
jgi:hypothetical protein